MAEERSGVGGLGGGGGDSEEEYSRWGQTVGRVGFSRRSSRSGSAEANLATLGKGLEKLIAPNSGVIARLQTGLEKLVGVLNRMPGMQGASTLGGATPSTTFGGYSVNPHSGFAVASAMPTATSTTKTPSSTSQETNTHAGFSATQLKIGAAAYGINQVGNAYSSRMDATLGLAPGVQGLASFSGLGGDRGYGNVTRLLQQRSLALGTTGPADTLQGAAYASQISGSYLGTQRGQQAMQNISAIALTNPGMGLGQAGSVYESLRSGSTLTKAYGYGLPTFQGRGGSQPNPIGTSLALTSALGGYRGRITDINQFNAQFQNQQLPYKALANFTGSPEAADAVLGMARAQINFQNSGGKRTLDPTSDADLRKGGVSSTDISQMRNYTQMQSQNQFIFSQKMTDNIAASLVVQKDIKSAIDKLVTGFGFGGSVASLGSRALGGIASSPLGTVGTFAMLQKLTGGGGVGLAEGAGLAGLSGLLKGLGPAAVGILAGGAIQKIGGGKNKAAGYAGAAVRGAGIMSTIGLMGPDELTLGLSAPVLAGAGAAGGALLHALGIGDPADVTYLEGRNRSSGNQEVTGLQPSFEQKVAQLFRANPNLVLNSGFRSRAQQQQIWDASGHNRMRAAPPGSSMHEKGLAVDIGPPSQYGWLKANAGKYGLVNYAPEPWHWEPKGASNAGNRTDWGVSANGGSTGKPQDGGGAPSPSGGGGGRGSLDIGGVFESPISGLLATLGSGTVLGSPNVALGSGGASGGSFGAASGGSGGVGGGSNVVGGGGLPTSFGANTMGHTSIDAKNLAGLLKSAGFSTTVNPQWGHSPLVEMLAIAMGESGLHIDAVGDTGLQNSTWGPSIGLFQDRTLRAQTGTGGPRDIKSIWGNAMAQVRAAYQLSAGGTNLGPWGGPGYPGHTSHLSAAQAAAGIGDPPAMASSGGNVSSLRSHSTAMNVVFHVNVQQASPSEAERLARFAYRRIQQLMADEVSRSI